MPNKKLALSLLLLFSPLISANDNRAADIAAGKETFMAYCAKCHGKKADGDGRLAVLYRRLLEPKPSDFRVGYFEYRPAAYLRKIITDGGEAHSRSKYMPPFQGELSDEAIEQLILFIQETGKRRQVPVAH